MLSRHFVLGLLGLVPAVAVSIVACQGKSSSAPPGNGDDGGSGGDDGGGVTPLTYSPAGCQYTYSPPSTLAYEDLAVDDTGPVDATNGVPQRVRVGLGGGTTAGQPGYADPTTMAAFTWETAESNHAAKVQMGTSASSLSQVHGRLHVVAQAHHRQRGLSYFHEVHVCGLTPGHDVLLPGRRRRRGRRGVERDAVVHDAAQRPAPSPSASSATRATPGATWQAVHERMSAAACCMSLVDRRHRGHRRRGVALHRSGSTPSGRTRRRAEVPHARPAVHHPHQRQPRERRRRSSSRTGPSPATGPTRRRTRRSTSAALTSS